MPDPNERCRRRPSERALAIYRRHAIVGRRRAEVAKEFGCSVRRVSLVCRGVERWISEQPPDVDVPALKLAHHLMLNGLAQEALAEWERSKQSVSVTKARMVQGRTDKSGAPQTVVTSEQVDRPQCGNPRYLHLCNDLLKSIRGIWGADAPRAGAAADDGPATLAGMLASLEADVPEPPKSYDPHPSNVFDAASVKFDV